MPPLRRHRQKLGVWSLPGVPVALLLGGPAVAQAPEANPETAAERAPTSDPLPEWLSHVSVGGWIETYYAWSFNEPSSGIIDLRGFDNRHNSANLSNAVLDISVEWEGVHADLTLQWGSTPATYYLGEPTEPALGTGVGAQDADLWRTLPEAHFGYRIPVGNSLDVSAGLFLSPVGVESLAVKDNWLYSRTNLFYGYPFYHTGLRASYPVSDQLTVVGWVVNGWNTLLDNNDEKSFIAQAQLSLGDIFQGTWATWGASSAPETRPRGGRGGTCSTSTGR